MAFDKEFLKSREKKFQRTNSNIKRCKHEGLKKLCLLLCHRKGAFILR